MHHQRGLVRSACTARNAYNPLLALTSTLLATSNDIALKKLLLHHAPSYCADQNKLCPQRRAFTSSHYGKDSQQAAAKDDHGGEQGMRKGRPQRKGTFAGYEALMGSVGNATREQQDDTRTEGLQHSWISVESQKTSSKARVTGDGSRGHLTERSPHARPREFDTHERRSIMDPHRINVAEKDNEHTRAPWNGNRLEMALPHKESDTSEGDILFGAMHDWKAIMHRIGEQANAFAQKQSPLSPEEFEEMKSRLDYNGVPFFPEGSRLDHEIPFPWTVTSKDRAAMTGLEILNAEIKQFVSHMKPTQTEITARSNVRAQVLGFIDQHIGHEMQPSYFGSERTGLFSATSDLDFRVQPKKGDPTQPRRNHYELTWNNMKFLSSMMLRHRNWILVVLRNARFPIINAQHRQTGIDVQIVSSPSTKPQHDATEQYLKIIPNLRPLFFLVKNMFGMRGLVDVFNGGTGSYGLLMMLVASLTRRGAQQVDAEPGTQLLQFLDFYCEHDYTRNGIAVAPPNTMDTPKTTLFRKHGPDDIPRSAYIKHAYARKDPVRAGQWGIGQARPFQPYLPCIQDPANPHNDLGRKMNAIKHIVATLQQIRTDLRAGLKMAEKGQLGEGMSLLEPVVGRCHEVYSERRRRIEEYGLGILRRKEEHRSGLNRVAGKRTGQQNRAEQAGSRQQQKGSQPVEPAWAG